MEGLSGRVALMRPTHGVSVAGRGLLCDVRMGRWRRLTGVVGTDVVAVFADHVTIAPHPIEVVDGNVG